MNKVRYLIAACASVMLLFVLALPGSAVSADPATGTPTVEIDLGADNAGAEFYFKTDAGIMPGTLKADPNGVITVELGGSSRYILTYAGASAAMPSTEAPEETAGIDPETPAETEAAEPSATQEGPAESGEKPPVRDMIIFFGGLALCGGFLLGSKIWSVIRSKKAAKEEEF